MKSKDRRVFLMKVMAAGTALAGAGGVQAQANRLAETDAQGSALGYRENTAKVDSKKYPRHAASQKCSNCQLYTGKAGEAFGPCSIFPGKVVAAEGWCSAWVKKAG